MVEARERHVEERTYDELCQVRDDTTSVPRVTSRLRQSAQRGVEETALVNLTSPLHSTTQPDQTASTTARAGALKL